MRFDDVPLHVIDRARSGDAHAMEELCLMVQQPAYAVIMSLVRNEEDALDTMQDALIRMIRFLPKLRHSSAFSFWLMRLLVNQCMTTFHKRPAAVMDVSAMDDPTLEKNVHQTSVPPSNPREAVQALELGEQIKRAIEKLPARQKTAITLFEVEFMTVKQVAEIMEISEGAVKFHLHEARKTLKVLLHDLAPQPQLKENSAK